MAGRGGSLDAVLPPGTTLAVPGRSDLYARSASAPPAFSVSACLPPPLAPRPAPRAPRPPLATSSIVRAFSLPEPSLSLCARFQPFFPEPSLSLAARPHRARADARATQAPERHGRCGRLWMIWWRASRRERGAALLACGVAPRALRVM